MEMVHKEPVRWTHDRIVSCEGGGGPSGHPRIFINTDKPEICTCNYCGIPFVCLNMSTIDFGLMANLRIGERTSQEAS